MFQGEANVVLPCNLQRMIWNARTNYGDTSREPTDLSPLKVIKEVQELCKRLIVVRGGDSISKQACRLKRISFLQFEYWILKVHRKRRCQPRNYLSRAIWLFELWLWSTSLVSHVIASINQGPTKCCKVLPPSFIKKQIAQKNALLLSEDYSFARCGQSTGNKAEWSLLTCPASR